jgi:hypothetical protein
MAVSLFIPFASAAGMASCDKDPGAGVDGICDTYSDADDGTANLQDWIEGTYDFTMLGTEQIQLELTWAIREFDREALGFTNAFIASALAADGLDEDDGAPADFIRNYFDQESAGSGSPTVGEKLKIELSDAIEESLESSFGQVAVSTDYTGQYDDGITTTACSTDPTTDSAEEGASENNVFNPPICISTSALIQVDQSTFNLLPNPDLDLERAYQGLMVMGTEITSTFDFVARKGHLATYTVNPPSYATIDSVDASGSLIAQGESSPYNSGTWTLDHRGAQSTDSDLTNSVELSLKHRNRTDTTTVSVPEDTKAIDLRITLDLGDESAAVLDFTAGMHYLDEATLNDWGVSLISVAERATVPVVTADGIRLAYHNGLVDLSNFTSQFPVDLIAEGVSSTVAGIETIEMNEMTWVSTMPANGDMPAGGLNYSHSTGCTEVPPGGVDLHFCVEGPEAMGYGHPVYLKTTSQPFSMRLLDIISENNDNEEVAELLDVLTEDDLERVLNGGLTLETVLNSDYLSAIVPANLPPSELTLEIILPSWVRTANGGDRLVLTDSIAGNDTNSISFAGTNPYDWRHAIRDDYQNVLCPSTQKTCVTSEIEIDAMSIDINEFTQTLGFEFALDADISVHRVTIPQDFNPSTENHSISMQVLPSDLVRLGLDIASRVDEPINRTYNLSEVFEFICNDDAYSLCDETIEFVLTADGLMAFTKRIGELFTQYTHEAAARLSDYDEFQDVDISDFQIKTRLKGVGAPDLIVSDEEALSLTLTIPQVTFQLQLDGDWGAVMGGDIEGLKVSLLTDAIRSMFVQPMANMMQGVTGMLTNSIVAWDGVTVPNGADSDEVLSLPLQFNSTLNDDFELGVNGPITILMPKGITLENLESTQDNIVVRTLDGRQEITYNVPAGEIDDTVSFQVKFTWTYFFFQFWKYPAILVILLLLFVRRRRKKKKKKKARRTKAAVAAKAQLGNSEFADLSGFSSTAIHGDLEELRDYDNRAPPPMPPMDAPAVSEEPSFDDALLQDPGDERFE